MAARRRIQVDDRTRNMSREALTCRSFGHAAVPIPVETKERLAAKRRGQRIIQLVCSRGCGYERRIVADWSTCEVISQTTKYNDPGSYLVREQGAGRIPRQSSRAAFYALVSDE
jgi:hypothetical protein